MKLIDYTGKLNTHEKYLEIIDKLEKITKYIEVVIIDGKESNDFVEKFRDNIISIKKVSNWWGTETTNINKLYKLKNTKEIFVELRKFETFCKYYSAIIYKDLDCDSVEYTDFGIDDIAFYNENDEYILFTTTHEGYITINEELIN